MLKSRIGDHALSTPDRICYAILFLALLLILFGVDTTGGIR